MFISPKNQSMGWLKQFLFVVAVISCSASGCYGRNSSNLEVVQRYEQCVLNRLSSSQFFTEEDRVRVIKIAKETNLRMHLLYLDPVDASNVRTMLRLFNAAVANLVAVNDALENARRKDSYVTVTKTCSLPLPQRVSEELLHEGELIFSSVKNAQSAGRGGNESPVLSRRREMSSEFRSETPDDLPAKQRSKRSPQAASFGSFGVWKPTESLQTVLSNILLNSNAFLNVFKSGISRRDALYYARYMVEAGLVNYHFSVVQEVVNTVSNAISSFPFRPDSRDYAFAIASSIVSVLDARQLSFFADGVGIGNGLVSKLQTMLDNKAPSVSVPTRSDGASSSFSWSSSSGSVPTQQRPMSRSQVNSGFMESKQAPAVFSSSQVDPEQFQSDLAFFLYQSNKIQSAFCNGAFQGTFDVVSEALSDYGLPISVTAATIVTDSLTAMGSDLACVQFGSIISETVTNILKENNLLQSADAQGIAEKMASNINPRPRQDFKASPSQSQRDFSSQSSSRPFSGSQPGPPVFTDFSFPEMQPSALNPESSFETPEFPSFGMLPMNPMDKTNFKDNSGTQGFPFEAPFSSQIPGQQSPEEYPLLNPSFEPAAPADYFSDGSGTISGTGISSGQQASADAIRPDSKTDEFSGHRFESPDGSPPISNPSNSPMPLDSRMRVVTAPGNPPNVFANSQSEANTEFQNKETMMTLPPSGVIEPEDIQPSITVDVMTTTTPSPYSTTSIDSSKLAEILLDDINASLRALNSSLDDEKQPQTGYESSTIENKDSSAVLESTTSPTLSSMDGIEPDETKLSTVASGDESRATQEPDVGPEQSFGPTSSSNSNEGTSVGGFENGTQNVDSAATGELELRDPTVVFAEHVSSIASSSIAVIRSNDGTRQELCNKLNELAAVVDIPPLGVCDNDIAFVDFLLNALKAVTFILRSV